MKVERIEKKVYEDVYVSFDGKQFKVKEECEKYEKSADGVINKMFSELEVVERASCENFMSDCGVNYGYDNDIAIVHIGNVNELEILNRFLDRHGEKQISSSYIGRTVALEIYSYDDGVYVIGTKEEMLSKFIKELDHLFNDDKEAE